MNGFRAAAPGGGVNECRFQLAYPSEILGTPHKSLLHFLSKYLTTMASTTPRTKRTTHHPPRAPHYRKPARRERSTGTRSRFYEACDRRFDTKESITDITKRFRISARTSLN